MSNIMVGLAFKADMATVNRKAVLLKLADHAHDDGTSIYPSVALVAEETHLSKRTVQRVLSEFVDVDLLRLVAFEGGGRGKSRNYTLNVPMLQALALGSKDDRKSPFKKGVRTDKRVTAGHERVTQETEKGDTACHPNHQEPSGNISDQFSEFWSAYPRKENRAQAEVEFKHAAEKTKPETIIAGAKAFAVQMAKQNRENKYIRLPAKWLSFEEWAEQDTSAFEDTSRYRMISKNDPEWEQLLAEREAAGRKRNFLEQYGACQVPAEYKPGKGKWSDSDGGMLKWTPEDV